MNIIDEINKRLTISEVLSYLPEMKENGHNYIGKCPVGHSSKSGTSFQVNTIEPTFNCFNCGVSGNYIHLIELIKFGSCSRGKKASESFKGAIKYLANKYEINQQDSSYEGGVYSPVFDIIEYAVSEYQSQLKKTNMAESICKKYGFNKEFLETERWGYGAVCPSVNMREYWTQEELLSSGLFNKSEKSKTGVFHIYQGRLVIPYNDYGVVKYTIGRKTSKTNNWGNGVESPKYFKQYLNSEKRPWVSKSIKNQIIKCSKDNDEVVITEGVTDYLSAKMHGINSVSAVTTSFKRDEYGRVVEFCKNFKRVYIANDNDENQAGQKGTDRICEMLLHAGINPFVILLPRGPGVSKIDLNEFIKDKGVEAFHELKLESESYIDHLINKIPPDTDKKDLVLKLEPICNLLSSMPKHIAEVYVLDKIKQRFKLSSFKNILRSIQDLVFSSQTEVFKDKDTEDDKSSIFKDHENDIKLISSGQDYKEGFLYYTITRPKTVTDKNGIMKVVNEVLMVCSNGDISVVKDYQIIKENFALQRKLGPEYRCEYWSFKDGPYSVNKYVNGKAMVDPRDLYEKLLKFINRFVYFKKNYDASFCAVLLMVTSLFMVFNAVGYVHLLAEKRSGKTTLLEIFHLLGFNSQLASSISDAALFRSVEAFRCMLLIDEAENLNPTQKQREVGQSEKLELLKAGYKKSGSATRCEGQSNSVVTFHNYCMKIFAGTKGADSILEDRMILLEMIRAMEGVEIEELIEANVKDESQELRDMIYCFGMQYAKDVDDIYRTSLSNKREELKKSKVTFRQKELWTPYLCVAKLIDDKSHVNESVFNIMLEKARDGVDTREAFGGDTKSLEIVERLYLWIKRVQDGKIKDMSFLYDGDVYIRRGISDHFIKDVLKSKENEDDFSYMTYQKLKQLLRKFHIIDKDSDLKNHNTGGSKGSAIILDRCRMLKAIMTYKNNFDEEVLEDINKMNNIKTEVEYDFNEEGLD